MVNPTTAPEHRRAQDAIHARAETAAQRAEDLKKRDAEAHERVQKRLADAEARAKEREEQKLPAEPIQTEEQLLQLDRMENWRWGDEPYDWSSVPTWYTPDAYSPVALAFRSPDDQGAVINLLQPDEYWNMTTKATRALAALEILREAGYTADPADLPQPEAPPGSTSGTTAMSGMQTQRATNVPSAPRLQPTTTPPVRKP